MLNFLNQNSGALIVIFTAVVTFSTVIYALLTAMLVTETRRMRQAQTEPKVQIIVKQWDQWINIVGLGPAYDISFNVSADAGGEGAEKLITDFTKANFFRIGLKYLGPGQELVPGYSQMTKDFEKKIESILVFTVQYQDATGKKYQESFRIDFSEFKGTTRIGKPHLYAIAENLEKIEKDISNIATGFKRIQVDIYNNDDRKEEQKEWDEESKESNSGS
jgi:hypothetical protein